MSGSVRFSRVDRFRGAAQGSAQPCLEAEPPAPDTAKQPPSRLSLRLSVDERSQLERDSAGQSLSAYARQRLFGDDPMARQKRRHGQRKRPVKDHEALARVLAGLGRSEGCASLRHIAQAAETGGLQLSQSDRATLGQACADISAMKRDWITALGFHPK